MKHFLNTLQPTHALFFHLLSAFSPLAHVRHISNMRLIHQQLSWRTLSAPVTILDCHPSSTAQLHIMTKTAII